MRLTAICLTLLACVSAVRLRRDADGAVVASSTQSLEDIVDAIQYEPVGTTQVVLSPEGDVRYTFRKHEHSIESSREFLTDTAKLSNGQRLARGMKPRRPGRLYVGSNGRLRRRDGSQSTTTCPYPYVTVGINFQTLQCSNGQSCTQGDVNVIACFDNVLAQACTLFDINVNGAVSVQFFASSGNIGKCMVMGSCCPSS